MDQAIQGFILALAAERGASQNTLGAYNTDLRQFEDYLLHHGILAWGSVTTAHVSDFVTYLGARAYATTSVARKLAALKSFFHYLAATQTIMDDPAAGVAPPHIAKERPRALAPDDVTRLILQPATDTPAGLRDAAMLHVLYGTGLRVSELVALGLNDLDDGLTGVRCVGRNGRDRTVPLPGSARRVLMDYLDGGRPRLARGPDVAALFLNHHGEQLTRQGFWLIIKGHAARAGIGDITPHTLRHSFAREKLGSGMELRSVQQLLGHASISTTQMYRHLLSEAAPSGISVARGGSQSGESSGGVALVDRSGADTRDEASGEASGELPQRGGGG